MLILRASKAAYIEYFTQTRFPISLLRLSPSALSPAARHIRKLKKHVLSFVRSP